MQDVIVHLSQGLVSLNPAGPIQLLINTGTGQLVDCTAELIVGEVPRIGFVRDIHVADFNGVTCPSYDGESTISVKISTVQDPDGFTVELNQLHEALR